MFDGEVVVVAEHQRYSYRAYPTAAQTLMLAKTFGCARVVFNDFVAHCRDAYETRGFVPDLDEVKSLVTAQAKHTPERHWLSEVSAVALQESARDAQAGYRAFVASVARTRRGPRVNPPRFKQKSGR
nr:helix-turn-helix domain-containing protein [Prescottella equi]